MCPLGRDPFQEKIPHIVDSGHMKTSNTALVYMNWDVLVLRCRHKSKYRTLELFVCKFRFEKYAFDNTQRRIIYRYVLIWHFYWKLWSWKGLEIFPTDQWNNLGQNKRDNINLRLSWYESDSFRSSLWASSFFFRVEKEKKTGCEW